MEAKEREKPLVKDLNEHIVCPLCRGYLIDATTLMECLHSFCRGCIVRRLSSGARACPVCNVATSPPLLPDVKLQRLVYLAVPGLFRSELERRRHFRLVNPQCPPLGLPLGALDLTLDDFVSLSLCELDEPEEEATRGQPAVNRVGSRHRTNVEPQTKRGDEDTVRIRSTRYLKCPAGVTVRHLVRLLMLKRGWEDANNQETSVNRIEMLCEKSDEQRRGGPRMTILDQSWTLLDLACIFDWKREAPMKLFYRVVRKEDAATTSQSSPYDDRAGKDATTMENIQRPPTPPPSPKPAGECEVEARRLLESNGEPPRSREASSLEREKEPKAKKPRCEVTPVMRTPDLVPIQSSHHAAASTKSKDLSRLEHRKRRKRRNKRVIAEITTTPREDLLKLKVRLTPCPPRITSSSSGGQTKEKLLQMRAVRREKIKAGQQRSSGSLVREETTASAKESLGDTEETIEEIIDGIPDEVVRIAQNISTHGEDASSATTDRLDQRHAVHSRRSSVKTEDVVTETAKTTEQPVETDPRPKKDEEILRRLGLVAVKKTADNFPEKAKQPRGQSNTEKELNREKLEKQLRESKANRVRSLLAEKQMRDALKSIMSNAKDRRPSAAQSNNAGPKKKGPPPLAPLRVAKPGFATSSAILDANTSKYEIPLDLSSGGTVHNNVLDLSANLSTGNFITSPTSSLSFSPTSSSSSSLSSPSSSSSSSPSSSSSSSSCSIPSLNPRAARPAITSGCLLRGKTKDSSERQQRGHDSNLVTLSNAAVSLLSGCVSDKKNTIDPLMLGAANIASKVALRIPQPHQRITGFGMKIKPNMGVRHIPNPQAVVASQYRNQRIGYLNSASQQQP